MTDILSVSGALAVVLTLAYAAVWLLRRMQPKGGEGPDLRFLRALPVGPRERVVAVRWRDETLLLGVTSGAITVIDRTPEPSRRSLGSPQGSPSAQASGATATATTPRPSGAERSNTT